MRMIPKWALPLEVDAPLKGARGGRAAGRSHYFAESLVERMVERPHFQAVAIREIQKSLKFSAKKLIEAKIIELGVDRHFDVLTTEIRRRHGRGICIFQGMQDHTADSIKSLEGFDLAWCEEAQSLSARSIELLEPTIRKDGSEIWCSWNPRFEADAVERFITAETPGAVLVHSTYLENPACPAKVIAQAEAMRARDLERYNHVWLGHYDTKSEAQIFRHCIVDEFTPDPKTWDGPYDGLDFGFSVDPTAAVRCWIFDKRLYVEHEAGGVGMELDHTAREISRDIPGIHKNEILADSARPESISYLRRKGLPRIMAADKWPGSVEDGIEFIKAFDAVVIHVRCKNMQDEVTGYRYKVKKDGSILSDPDDKNNHYWDAVRYALSRLIRKRDFIFESL